ncbi:hypothetical protein ElyMa_006938200 [Elysia marginata]|uniref:Uncharacterized protein n=1 Tax=Elysia marginata TaxID=1093978 RepID=A0AAV4JGM9_9GAST|nr:hypothetical protein ElyMa_006938200 [Elysia marginata]
MSAMEPDLLPGDNKCSVDTGYLDGLPKSTKSCPLNQLDSKSASEDTITGQNSTSNDKPQFYNTATPKCTINEKDKDIVCSGQSDTENIQGDPNIEISNRKDSIDVADNLKNTKTTVRPSKLNSSDTARVKRDTCSEHVAEETLKVEKQQQCFEENRTPSAGRTSVTRANDKSQLPNFLQVETATSSAASVPSNINHTATLPSLPTGGGTRKKQPDPKIKTEPHDDIKVRKVKH